MKPIPFQNSSGGASLQMVETFFQWYRFAGYLCLKRQVSDDKKWTAVERRQRK